MRNRRLEPFASLRAMQPGAPFCALASLISAPDRRVMKSDEADFRIRPGKVRDRGRQAAHTPRPVRARSKTFVGEVQQAMHRAGYGSYRPEGAGKESGRCNARGRGAQVAAALKGRNGWGRDARGVRTRARRVAVKARIVKLNPQRGAARGRQFVNSKAVDAHLRYLERDGVTRDGEKGQVYSADHDAADGSAFLDRGREDRHQFRFIVSAEEGVELSDLRETTRDLMTRMEADLCTKLDWIAVDHHNTGHPHTHILLRGVTDDGKMLNIAGDYIAHGIRERASEIVTLELGRQTEQDVSRQLASEVDAERFTQLDRMLIAEQDANNEFADLRPDRDMRETFRQNRALLIARARMLERMGLATEQTPGIWTISPHAEPVLRDLGTRGDIIKTMHQALKRDGVAGHRQLASYALHGTSPADEIVGRVVAKGLGADELGERIALTIDGIDGRVHHVEVPSAKACDIRRGSIVAVEPPPSSPRSADRNILAATDGRGVYSPTAMRELVLARLGHVDPDDYVRSHVRRLEALRRAGIVARIDAEHWTVPADLPERGLAHDRQRFGTSLRIDELSHLSLDRQVHHEGATWLDRTMLDGGRETLPHTGFGGDMRAAWESRKQALADMGYACDRGGGEFRAPRDVIARLERAEINREGMKFAVEHGLDWRPAVTGQPVSGTLVGQARLASGRFAMIEDGLGFSLVPWNNVLEKRRGQTVSGIPLPGGGFNWSFGRNLGLGL